MAAPTGRLEIEEVEKDRRVSETLYATPSNQADWNRLACSLAVIWTTVRDDNLQLSQDELTLFFPGVRLASSK